MPPTHPLEKRLACVYTKYVIIFNKSNKLYLLLLVIVVIAHGRCLMLPRHKLMRLCLPHSRVTLPVLQLVVRHHVLDPAQTLLQIVIDARLMIDAAAKAGAGDADEHKAAAFLDHQRAARVAWRGERDLYNKLNQASPKANGCAVDSDMAAFSIAA